MTMTLPRSKTPMNESGSQKNDQAPVSDPSFLDGVSKGPSFRDFAHRSAPLEADDHRGGDGGMKIEKITKEVAYTDSIEYSERPNLLLRTPTSSLNLPQR